MRPLLVLAAVLAIAAPAQASFPGRNGDLVVSVDDGSCELGSNLFRVTLGGAQTQLTDVCQGEGDDAAGHYAGAPEASPDGASLLFFTNTVATGVATLALDGGATAAVPISAKLSYDPTSGGTLSFFPDGASFAVAKTRYRLDGTSTPLEVADGHVSPDGGLIAAFRGSALWLYSAKTGKRLRRVAKRAVDVDWSPDGRRLVYATGYEQREVEGGASGGNLYVVGRDGRHRRTLVHRKDIAETEPTWSPDGKTVAWVSLGFSSGDVGFDIAPSLWRVSVRTGKRARIRSLTHPFNEEGYYHRPELTWLPRP